MIYPLNHQVQPTATTCMSTCLAMLLDRPVEDIISLHHEDLSQWEITIGDILCMNGIPFILGKGINQVATIYHDYVYVLCAPSLTSPGILHQILLDTRHGNTVVYDPLKGSGKPYYTLDEDDESPLAVKLVSWVVDYIVDPHEIGAYHG
ncbi:hypothetical protein DEEACLCL_00092 [Salmonella phage CRW-SP2]|nr:hypothetical protein DEEACLCL_00092 [Salmonella phage CRW-SP2]